MSVFNSLNKTTARVVDIGERYIKASHQYLELKIFQQLTLSISLFAKVLLIGGFLSVGLLFCSVALALELGNYFSSLALGCITVGGIYMFIALILALVRKKINKIVIKTLGANFFN
jgi:hypothetical protein